MTVTGFIRRPLTSLDGWWEEASPKRRIDFNFGNMGMLLGLMMPSLSIVLNGPVPSSVLDDMPVGLQIAMCAAIFFGCGMKLHGALGGRRFWFPRMDPKRCYTWGYAGAPIAFVGTVTYGYFILSNTPNFWSAMSGVSTPLFGLGIMGQAALYLLEYRRIDRNERRGIQAEIDHKAAEQ